MSTMDDWKAKEKWKCLVKDMALPSHISTKENLRWFIDNGALSNKDHPNFVIENLTSTGPLFLSFRTDVCAYCDYMEPLVKEIFFNLTFEKEDVFYKIVNFNGTDVTFVHINTDYAKGELFRPQETYDIDGDGAVPMFTTITLGYDHGIIKPYYNTVYGILDPDYTDRERMELLTNIILDGIEYLITYSGDMFESVLRSLRKLTDKISISNTCLIIPLDPDVVSKERIALFSRSGIEIVTPPK